MKTDQTLPAGYWRDAKGRLVPPELVAPLDQLRDQTVRQLVDKALALQTQLQAFKGTAFADVAAMVATSAEQYGVALGGEKGNVVLTSYDGTLKVVRAYQDRISFDERIKAVKALIDACLEDWTADAVPELKALVTRAFESDRGGDLRVQRILELRRLEIADERWKRAMQALDDAIKVDGTAGYIRLYQRGGANEQWQPICLDLAAV
ncbi:protein of unknown function [Pseudogulbenkiania sp. NH8B]|uniref:DUF3164 family protein n=1 Tax=Pseudogulbenkiania sp. (strain NH8B) TaxID=748280 RepID=UPI0002279B3F|nr:DUF3164 family protein [Pseudogulbenkiania sp. NH8B]BAK76468.1 protein of unknown function [Pseudogulbenkiania sp. NH8B]BAK76897.1 protein of unknown function [Pseudogulbenkiania sp. NH8B]